MKLIIYLPALNEEENIKAVIEGLPKRLDHITCIQFLVIDDGSQDGTAALARTLGADVIEHGRNRGVGAAFQSAVQFALENKADILLGIDADGQFDPAEIPALIAPILNRQAEMVIGSRFGSGIPMHMPRLKFWGNGAVTNIISFVCGQKFKDVSCGFRAYSHEALMHLNLFADFTYTHETILSLVFQGLTVIEHPIKVRYIPDRKSRVAGSVLKYSIQTSKIILRVVLDYRPIYVFGNIGMVLVFIGSLFVLFLMGHYFLTQSYTPYKSFGFIGLGFFIIGFLVLLIALIADMLNRLRINQSRILYELRKSRYEK